MLFFFEGGGCFTCNSQLLPSHSTPAPCRGLVWSAPSPAPALFHWLCCWGTATCCCDPWGMGCGRTRWNGMHLKRMELPCLENARGLKREGNQTTLTNYETSELFLYNKELNKWSSLTWGRPCWILESEYESEIQEKLPSFCSGDCAEGCSGEETLCQQHSYIEIDEESQEMDNSKTILILSLTESIVNTSKNNDSIVFCNNLSSLFYCM